MKKASLIGSLSALLVLAAPLFLPTVILFGGWIAFIKKWKIKKLLFFFFGFVFCIGIWSARNWATLGSPVPFSSNGGLNLLLGNSENFDPLLGTMVDISKYIKEAELKNLDEISRDTFYRDSAIDFIMQNKLLTIKNYFLKFAYYFHYKNELATSSEMSTLKTNIMLFTYWPLLLFFLVRLAMAYRTKLSLLEWFLLVSYITSGAFSAIFFTRIRFRIPFDALLIAAVVIGAARLIDACPKGSNNLPRKVSNIEH